MNFTTTFQLDAAQGATVRLTSKELDFVFSYSYLGAVDGVPLLNPNKFRIRVSSFYSDIGYDTVVLGAQVANQSNLLMRPGKYQWVNFLARLQFHRFKEMYYDPDVQLALLFNTEDPPISSSNLSSDSNVGLAVGIAVPAVLVVGGVAVTAFLLRARSQRILEKHRLDSAFNKSNEVATRPSAAPAPKSESTSKHASSRWQHGSTAKSSLVHQ